MLVVAALASACGGDGLSRDARAHYDEGITLVERGLLMRAAAELEQARDLEPEHAPTRLALARVYAELGQFERSTAEIDSVLARDPDSAEAHAVRGRVLMLEGRTGEAERSLHDAAARFPRSAEVLRELGELLAETGRGEEAIATFERASSLDARLPYPAALDWAIALETEGRMDEARKMYARAIERAPEREARAFWRLGWLLVDDEADRTRGISLLEEAVRRQPGEPEALDRMGRAYLLAGRAEEARNLLQRAVRATSPVDPALADRRAALARAEDLLPSQPPPPDAPDVVLVVIDTLRRDHLGVYGYGRDVSPAIDALARDSVVVEDAVSQAPWTAASIATMLTGLYPSAHGLDGGVRFGVRHGAAGGTLRFAVQKTLGPAQVTLAEMLRRNGYQTAGFVSNTYVNSIFGFAQGFETYQDEHGDYSDRPTGKRRGDVTNRLVFQWLAAQPREPFFLFVHYNDPHLPYDPPAPWGREWVKDYRGSLTPQMSGSAAQPYGRPAHDLSREDADYLMGLYDGEIRFSDENVRALLDRLGRAGLERPVLTIITADHGEEFLDHGSTSHGWTLYEEQIRVPLLFHGAGLAPRRVGSSFGLVDLAPTILGLAGIAEHLPHAQGRDLSAVVRGEADALSVPTFAEATYAEEQHAIRYARGLKLIEQPERNTELLFDLARDPAETTNLSQGVDAAVPRRTLDAWVEQNLTLRNELHPNGSRDEAVLDEEVQERLRALGYIR